MANIILRLPYYVACFMRNPSTDISLKPNETYVFSPYTDEYNLMAHALVRTNLTDYISSPCFSEQMWQRMRNGYGIGKCFSSKPVARPIAENDALSDASVSHLSGVSFGNREGFGDYLYISMPKEVVSSSGGGKIIRTNKSFSLQRMAATQLAGMMKRRFRYSLMEYMRGDNRFCQHHHIKRSVMESISRFMTKYDIPYSPDKNEILLLKRLYYRWREREDFSQEEMMEFGYGS